MALKSFTTVALEICCVWCVTNGCICIFFQVKTIGDAYIICCGAFGEATTAAEVLFFPFFLVASLYGCI